VIDAAHVRAAFEGVIALSTIRIKIENARSAAWQNG